MSTAHYLFLGRGDYVLSDVPLSDTDTNWRNPKEISTDPRDWSFSWDLEDWKKKVEFLQNNQGQQQ